MLPTSATLPMCSRAAPANPLFAPTAAVIASATLPPVKSSAAPLAKGLELTAAFAASSRLPPFANSSAALAAGLSFAALATRSAASEFDAALSKSPTAPISALTTLKVATVSTILVNMVVIQTDDYTEGNDS